MPNKAKLITRERSSSNVSSDNLNKGSELSFSEVDSNFINLRDQSIAISDGSTSTDIDAGETITFSGASVSGNTVTVPTGAGMTIVGDDSTGTLINGGETLKIAGGTNVTTAMSGDTLTITSSASGGGGVGDLTITGSTISSPSNGDLTLDPSGTGDIILSVDGGTPSRVKVGNGSAYGSITSNGDQQLEVSANGGGAAQARIVLQNDGNGRHVDIDPGTSGKIRLFGTMTGETDSTAMNLDGVAILDNTISANASNANLELDGSGSGKVSISGIKHPTSDGSAGQVLQTDGSGNLSFATISAGSSTGDITFNGSTMISPSNGDITLDPSGTGHILFKSDTTAIGDGSGSEAALLTTPNDVPLHIGPNTSQTNLTATNGLTNNSDGYIRLNSNGLITVRSAGDGYIYLGGETVFFGREGVGGTSAAGKISSLGRENFTITANNNINGWEPLILLTAPGSGSSASVKAQSKITMQAGDTGSGSIEMTTINIFMTRLPTSDPSVAGQLYNDSGTLKISAG